MPRTLLLLIFLPLYAFPQKKLNITIFGGFSNYSGDLQEKRFTLDQSHKAFGLGLSYELFPQFLLRGSLNKGKISAHDQFSKKPLNRQRNLHFVSNLYEASLVGDYSFKDLWSDKFTPYVFGGLAIFRFNPYSTDTLGRGVPLRLLSTEGQGLVEYPDRKPYRLITISVPVGVGIRLRITENAWLGYEIGLRKTFTDYIDDVSKTYVDEAWLASNRGRLAVEMAFRSDELKVDALNDYPREFTMRGNPKSKDWYYFSGITLSIGIMNEDGKLFGKKVTRGSIACPGSAL